MDFSFSEAQKAVAELARKIFRERVTPASLKAVEAEPRALRPRASGRSSRRRACSGRRSPRRTAGSGHGFLELCALLAEAGAAVAPVPLWPTLVLGAMPIARSARDEQRQRAASPRVATGEAILTRRARRAGRRRPAAPPRRARGASGGGWTLDGRQDLRARRGAPRRAHPRPRAHGATASLGVFLVDPRARGRDASSAQIATTGEPRFRVTLDGRARRGGRRARATRRAARAILEWLVAARDRRALRDGARRRASARSRMTADVHDDAPAVRAPHRDVPGRRAARGGRVHRRRGDPRRRPGRRPGGSRSDLPAATRSPSRSTGRAKAGHRVVYAAQHLHGGMGFDLEYPLHRYYLLVQADRAHARQRQRAPGAPRARLAAGQALRRRPSRATGRPRPRRTASPSGGRSQSARRRPRRAAGSRRPCSPRSGCPARAGARSRG